MGFKRFHNWIRLGCFAGAVLTVMGLDIANAASIAVASLDVSNPSTFARQSELVLLPLTSLQLPQQLSRQLNGASPATSLHNNMQIMEGDSVLSSDLVDTDGDGNVDALAIVMAFAPKQSRHLSVVVDANLKQPQIKKKTQAEISIKEGGQWKDNLYEGGHFTNVPHVKLPPQYTDHSNFIRYEGPGIESDKVAYRVYLDPRNGFDIFGKKIPDVVLQNVGHDGESYEDDAPWGLDIFKVGNSLGVGGFGYWNGKQVESIAVTESRESNIVANGNVYSAFNIQYGHWKVNNAAYQMVAMISMHAGSRLAHNQVQLSRIDKQSSMPTMAIGVVRHPNTRLIQSDPNSKLEWAYAASWGKQSRIAPDEYLGVGVIFHRTQRVQQTEDDSSYVSVMDVSKGVLDYYFLAAWDKELGGIKTEVEFKSFLDGEIQRLSVPVQIKLAKR